MSELAHFAPPSDVEEYSAYEKCWTYIPAAYSWKTSYSQINNGSELNMPFDKIDKVIFIPKPATSVLEGMTLIINDVVENKEYSISRGNDTYSIYLKRSSGYENATYIAVKCTTNYGGSPMCVSVIFK